MILAPLLTVLVGLRIQSQWQSPFTAVKRPTNYAQFESRLGPDGAGVFEQGDVLTFLCRGKQNILQLPDWIRIPFTRDEDDDVWVAQASMKGWDQSFFSYRLTMGGKVGEQRFYARHSPRAPRSASHLKGMLETIPFHSKELGETRNVTVYLPPHAGSGLNAIYMADGQSCADFAKLLEPLILAKKVAPTAIIGLFHGEYKGTFKRDFSDYDMEKDFRAREYLKSADPDRFESHLRFVVNEVVPWAEGKYGLTAGAGHRAVFGFSNGGAFALIAGCERPDVFGAAMPFSVAAFSREELRLAIAGKAMPQIWFAAGTLEVFLRNTEESAKIVGDAHAVVHVDSYVSGHDTAMWELAFARDVPLVFPFGG